MKKTLLTVFASILFGFAAVSCASHTTYRSYSDTQQPQSEGEWRQCAVCAGKGNCNACKGTGKISGDKCSTCNGSGRCLTCSGNGGYTVNY